MDFWLRAKLFKNKWAGIIYWTWRFSPLSRPWFWLKTFVHLHWHAKEIAVNLDNCMRAFGQMKHSADNQRMLTMDVETNSKLASQGYKSLPNGWRWRKD